MLPAGSQLNRRRAVAAPDEGRAHDEVLQVFPTLQKFKGRAELRWRSAAGSKDQPQQPGPPTDLVKDEYRSEIEHCCGWLSAQPRSVGKALGGDGSSPVGGGPGLEFRLQPVRAGLGRAATGPPEGGTPNGGGDFKFEHLRFEMNGLVSPAKFAIKPATSRRRPGPPNANCLFIGQVWRTTAASRSGPVVDNCFDRPPATPPDKFRFPPCSLAPVARAAVSNGAGVPRARGAPIGH